MNALDIVKNSDKCRGCVGGCDNCEYSSAFDQIEDAIYDYCELKREYDAVKAAEKLCREVERLYTNETYFAIIVKAISMCEDKDLVDNAIHCLAYLKSQLEHPHLKFEEMNDN